MLRYKACKNSIVTLELIDNSVTNEKRKDVFDSRYAKFRCDKAKVINITNVKTGETMKKDQSISRYHDPLVYILEKIVKTNFNKNLDTVCTEGIHYFKTKEAAVSWFYGQYSNFPDGKWIRWHQNGQKNQEGTFKYGLEDGKWIGYHENGNKKYEGTYKDGKGDGKWIRWHENGQKNQEGTYKNEKRDGKWIYWFYNGQKESEITYKNGERDGKWIYWHDTGEIHYEHTY